ncbi:trehalose 6-phosphate phosphatase [Microbacterium resistens]|uniref:Trehalose 6-phosphate phosphatase n=1 Tax=Microbacterium resistens TaxID=156977 RepID=A0ABU1S8C2_9MICO|nr:trehalose-phosphatase [Microbacterium resistens]MDR6865859.1 trehalose 6-phosphate phosphatase [Microbacterium resistens]
MARTWTPETEDPALTALAGTPRLLVALDFDGTASLHVDDPMAARALPEVAAAVARLAALPDTVVAYVSGRSMHHLRVITEHDDRSPLALAGSHGAQYWFPGEGDDAGDGEKADADPASGDPEDRAGIEDEVKAIALVVPGVEFEPKTFGFGIHARRATAEDEERVFALVDRWAAGRIPGWRRRTGHHIREFSWRIEGKDVAIARLRAHYGATGVLFAGDDVTDEDALQTLGAEDIGVRVGPGETAADLRVESPQQIAPLLGALAQERSSARE